MSLGICVATPAGIVIAWESSIPDLKVDFVEDLERLLHPIAKDGIASVDDIYLRKIRAAIGWTEKVSPIGRPVAGSRRASRRGSYPEVSRKG